MFTADHGKSSNCAGDCPTAWPPYTVKKQPLAGRRRIGFQHQMIETIGLGPVEPEAVATAG